MKGQGNRPGLEPLQRSVVLFGSVLGMINILTGLQVKDHLQIPHGKWGHRDIKWYWKCGSFVQSLHHPRKDSPLAPQHRPQECQPAVGLTLHPPDPHHSYRLGFWTCILW